MLTDGVSKSLCQNFFSREQPLSALGKILYFARLMDTETRPTSLKTNTIFRPFPDGLEFLNEAEKEKNNGKGNSVSAPSRFASLTERHSGKAKQTTNWSDA